MSQIDKSSLAPEVVAHLEGLETQVAETTEQLTKAQADLAAAQTALAEATPAAEAAAVVASPEADLIAKAAPELRELIAKAQQEAQEARAAVLVEKRARERQVLVQKFGAEMDTLPGATPEGLADLFLDLPQAQAGILEPLLKGAAEAIRTGNLFQEAGRGGVHKSRGALDEIDQAAQAIIAKSQTPLSLAQAKDQALLANPALYERYLREG